MSAGLRLEKPHVPAPSADDGAPEILLTQAQVAEWLSIKPRQVERLGVPAVRLGHRTLRYRRSDVESWLAGRLERR